MDIIRAISHLVVLICLLYLAIDEHAARRSCRAWVWAALAVERFAFLALLVVDVSRNGAIWMEWRANLTPFIILLAITLTVYTVNRIRGKRKLRRDIAPLLGVYG